MTLPEVLKDVRSVRDDARTMPGQKVFRYGVERYAVRSQASIAKELGWSQQRVQQTEKRALAKLKRGMKFRLMASHPDLANLID